MVAQPEKTGGKSVKEGYVISCIDNYAFSHCRWVFSEIQT